MTAEHALDLRRDRRRDHPATRLIFVCTPNNPTGTTVRRAELESFLDRVPDDVLVVIDEAYREFDDDPDSPDGLDYARPDPTWWRCAPCPRPTAWPACGSATRSATRGGQRDAQGRHPVRVELARPGRGPGRARSRDELAPRWRQVVAERERVHAALSALGYEVPTSQANFVWLPLRDRAAQFAAHCRGPKVIVRAFPDASGGVRVSIGAPEENDAFLARRDVLPALSTDLWPEHPPLPRALIIASNLRPKCRFQ